MSLRPTGLHSEMLTQKNKSWGYSSVVGCSPGVPKVLDSIPTTKKNKTKIIQVITVRYIHSCLPSKLPKPYWIIEQKQYYLLKKKTGHYLVNSKLAINKNVISYLVTMLLPSLSDQKGLQDVETHNELSQAECQPHLG